MWKNEGGLIKGLYKKYFCGHLQCARSSRQDDLGKSTLTEQTSMSNEQ